MIPEGQKDLAGSVLRLKDELRAARLRWLAQVLAALGHPSEQVVVRYHLSEDTALPLPNALFTGAAPQPGGVHTARALLAELQPLPVFDELLWLLHEDYDPALCHTHGTLTYTFPTDRGAVLEEEASSGARSPRPAGGPA